MLLLGCLSDSVLGVVARVGFVLAEFRNVLDDLFFRHAAGEGALGVGPVALGLAEMIVFGSRRVKRAAGGGMGGFLLAGWEVLGSGDLVGEVLGPDVVGLLVFVVVEAG